VSGPADIIASIYYVTPYASAPPGRDTAGLTVNVNQSAVPNITSPVLVIRLRLSNEPAVIGVSNTSGAGTSPIYALFQPPFPLSATAGYLVDLIWETAGTPPDGIDWNEAVATAPVTAAMVSVAAASFDGTNVNVVLERGPSSYQTGAKAFVYGYSGGVWAFAGSAQVEGDFASVPVNGYPAPYRLYTEALIPAVNQGGASSFTAPFSEGPYSPPRGVPQAAAAVTQADFDGASVSLTWTLDGLANAPAPDGSRVALLVGGAEVAVHTGGPTSASLPSGGAALAGATVKVQTQFQAIAAGPLSIPLITGVPAVTNVTINGAAVTASVATTAAACEGWLLQGDKVLAGPVAAANSQISFTYAATGLVGLAVVARGKSSDGKTTGPRSAPVPLLATAPVLTSAVLQTDPADATKWRLACQWGALPDDPSSVASFTVSVRQSSGTSPLAIQTTTAGAAVLSFAKADVVGTATQTIVLQATGISGGTSPSASQGLVFVTPTLTAVTATAESLAASWTAPAGVPAGAAQYAIRVLNGAGAGANTPLLVGPQVGGLASAVPLADLSAPSDGSAVVMADLVYGPLRVVADRSMAAGQQATAILAAPRPAAAVTNPVTGLAQLNWSNSGTGLTYLLRFSAGAPTTSATNQYNLASPAPVDPRLTFQVAATQTTSGVVITGPYSVPGVVPVAAGVDLALRYDGATAEAEWSASSAADAYLLSIWDDSNKTASVASATVAGAAGSLAYKAVAGKTYTLYVQPVTADGSGPAAASTPLFEGGFFLSQQPATAAVPYVYPAATQAQLGGAGANPPARAITLYLPQLGLTPGALGTTPITSGPFTLGPSGNTALPYVLTIAADASVWTFDTTAVRTALQTAYTTFLTTLEKPSQTLAGASPYGIFLVQEAIARMMPQSFDEQLYYNFGFSLATTAGAAYVDLRPGMVLRVALGDYVSINEQQLPSWLNGYVGASVFDFEIGSYQASGAWRVGFDGFLNQLASHNALQVPAPFKSTSGTGQSGVAAGADLYYSQFQQPFYRMFVPASLLSPSSTTNGNQASLNFAVVAAATYTLVNGSSPNPQQYATAYFRGRTTLEALIRVQVDGVGRLAPVGTSLGNLVEQLRQRPAGATGRGLGTRLLRGSGPGPTSLTLTDSIPETLEVMLSWDGGVVYGPGAGYDGFSLPLLAGDQIFTAVAGA
jgi:hypothetical protein